jgi:hypothetical protein
MEVHEMVTWRHALPSMANVVDRDSVNQVNMSASKNISKFRAETI